MAQALLLYLHSWLRWVVLGLGVAAFARAIGGLRSGRAFDAVDRKLRVAFTAALDSQVLLGVVFLIGFSAYAPTSLDVLKAGMKDRGFRFFAVEHGTLALLALASVHVAAVRVRRAVDDLARHRAVAVGVGIALALLLLTIPWPFLRHGRDLFRF